MSSLLVSNIIAGVVCRTLLNPCRHRAFSPPPLLLWLQAFLVQPIAAAGICLDGIAVGAADYAHLPRDIVRLAPSSFLCLFS